MKKIIVILITAVLLTPVFANWQLDLKVEAGRKYTLTIGVNSKATAGFDKQFDKVSPPPLPEGFSTFITINDPEFKFINRLWRDIRAPKDSLIWRINFRRPEERGVVKWNPQNLPEGHLFIDGTSIKKFNNGLYDFPTTDTTLEIKYYRQGILKVNRDSVNSSSLKLFGNTPNPFYASTQISFNVPSRGNTTLKIFTVLGKEAKTLIDKELASGSYKIIWNGKDNRGEDLKDGIYLYKLTHSGKTLSNKMLKVDQIQSLQKE